MLTHGFGQKTQIIYCLFLNWISLEIIFSNGLDRNQAFKDDKSTNFVKSEKWVSSKGVNPWFWRESICFLFVFKLN